MNSEPIQILGGGLAGLSLGLSLRQHSVPVVVHEAGGYPRHRVCGEFLSGRGITCLRSLGVLDRIVSAGGRWAETASFFSERGPICHHRLPQPALCVSRFVLDHMLARALCEKGGVVVEGSRRETSELGPGTVRATGRNLARPDGSDSRWFGVKAHVRGVELSADLEMHLVSGGYIGLCQLSDGRVNVCGLLRKQAGTAGRGVRDWLRGVVGSVLRQRLEEAQFDEESLCAVSGLDLRPRQARAAESTVGDALTMIPPITGNGMSLALESGQIASVPIADFSRGTRAWEETRREVASRLDRAFRRRLFWASWLHRGFAAPKCAESRLLATLRWSYAWRLWFWLTR